MKKIIFAFLFAVVFVSCDPHYGKDYFSPTYVSTPLKEYMLCISNDIVTESLKELESALKMDKEGTMAKYFYQTNESTLAADGSVWTVKREGTLKDATIAKVAGEQAWTIVFDGEYAFRGNKSDTQFTLKAAAVDPSAVDHRDWNVEIVGNRTEDDGYTCTFNHIDAPINYRAVHDAESSWNAFGFLEMKVDKNGTQVDALIMELRGGVNSASIARY